MIDAGLGIDDEYADIGVADPKLVITTSHNPSSRLIQFVKVCISIIYSRFLSFKFVLSRTGDDNLHIINTHLSAIIYLYNIFHINIHVL